MLIKRFLRNKMALLGLAIVIFVILTSLTASLVAPSNPLKLSLSNRIKAPSNGHFFGTDHFGRDLLSRVLYGGRVSLQVGVFSVLLAAIAGIIARTTRTPRASEDASMEATAALLTAGSDDSVRRSRI